MRATNNSKTTNVSKGMALNIMSGYEKRASRNLWFIVETLPILLPAGIAILGSVALVFLLIGQFKPLLIWPVGLIFVACTFSVILRHYPRDILKEGRRQTVNMLVIFGALLWGGFNIHFTTQHLLVDRDPAIYANTGIWLSSHDNIRIPTESVFGNADGLLKNNGSGFKTENKSGEKYIYAQGAHLLPAFIGLVARMTDVAKALKINVLFGMTALLAVYAVGRSLVRNTWWAAVGTGVLAASMPLIYFSRDSYSEPLAATFTFGSIALLWLALQTRKSSVWLLAGLILGAGTMTRIDGFLTVAEAILFSAIFLGITTKKEKADRVANIASLLVGMILTSAIGLLDLLILSPAYFSDLHGEFMKELLGISATVLFSLIFVFLSWKTKVLSLLDKRTRAWRGEISVLIFFIYVTVILSRSYWYHPLGRGGIPSHLELSAQWLTWYLGPMVVLLALAGAALALTNALNKRSMLFLAVLIIIGGTAGVYIGNPSIASDQIWASRRLVPVIIPGIVIMMALALDWFDGRILRSLKFRNLFIVFASLALIAGTLVISKPIVTLHSYQQLSFIRNICNSVPRDSALLWVGTRPTQEIVQPTRGVCNLPSQGYSLLNSTEPSKSELSILAKSASHHGKRLIIGTYSDQGDQLPRSILGKLKKENTYSSQLLEYALFHAPQTRIQATTTVELGMVRLDGSITPLE